MSRQIQIRRGSATEHENFTGAIGEITMDTTNKTLRVHDGETVGGIPLMRADTMAYATATTGETYAGNRIWFSEDVSPSTDENTVLEHNLNLGQPFMATAVLYLKFITGAAGYESGDIISQFNITPQILAQSDGTQIVGGAMGNMLNLGTDTVTIPRCVNGKVYVFNKITGVPELCSSNNVKIFVKIIY